MTPIHSEKRADGVLLVSLNRPEAGNRFDLFMLQKLYEALKAAEDPGVRAVLLTHEGDSFCLGGALGDARRQHAGTVQAFADALKAVLRAIFECPVPVVCTLEGDAEGGGLSIVEASDMAVASDRARFAIPEILSGMPPAISFAGAARVMPTKRLMQMALLGERITAVEAERAGLITKAVPPGTARTHAEQWIKSFQAGNGATLSTIRLLRRRMDEGQYARQLDAAGDLLVGVMMHKDTWDMLDRREKA